MYHISDLKKFKKCPRLYLLSKDEMSEFKPYLRTDESITDLLVQYFDVDNYYLGVKNDPPKHFFDELSNYEWFFRPRFEDCELRINIPLIHKHDDLYDLYYFYSNTSIKELDSFTINIGYNLLSKQGIIVSNIYIIYLNENYTNNGVLNPKELFLITDEYKNKKLIKIAENNTDDYESIVSKMNELNIDTCKVSRNKYCKQFGLCQYYELCFGKEEINDDSVLTLVSSKDKNDMYKEGIGHLKDVDISRIEGNRVQYAQIMASKNNGLFVDKCALKSFLKKLDNLPLSFVDFEWDRYLIPQYKYMKPMSVVCFEYALYYYDEKGDLSHKTFIGKGDCREEFVKRLISDIPSNGPILAYNADGAEVIRLKELAEIYPQYKDNLESIIARFIDLAIPFIEGLVYDVRMKGNYSLKKLVDICSDYSYKDLDIYDGMEAVFNWRNIDKNSCANDSKIISNLEEYCSLDAYGLLLVYKWLLTLLNGKGERV